MSARAGRAASASNRAMLWRMGLCRLLALRGCSVRAQASVVNLQPLLGEARRDRACLDLLKRVTSAPDRPRVRFCVLAAPSLQLQPLLSAASDRARTHER
mgnify:CR=1 FL=1